MSGQASFCEGMKCGICQLFLSILNLRVVLCCSKHGRELFPLGLRLFARQQSSNLHRRLPPLRLSLFHSHSVISPNFSVSLPRLTQKKPGPLAVAGLSAVIGGSVSALHTSPLSVSCSPSRFHPAVLSRSSTFPVPPRLLFAVTRRFNRGWMTTSHQSAATGCV